jgi:hypothetical protein
VKRNRLSALVGTWARVDPRQARGGGAGRQPCPDHRVLVVALPYAGGTVDALLVSRDGQAGAPPPRDLPPVVLQHVVRQRRLRQAPRHCLSSASRSSRGVNPLLAAFAFNTAFTLGWCGAANQEPHIPGRVTTARGCVPDGLEGPCAGAHGGQRTRRGPANAR